jgi:origin recognition complex subunit 1
VLRKFGGETLVAKPSHDIAETSATDYCCTQVQHQHLIYMNVLTGVDDPTRMPTISELDMVLESLVASRAMLIEDGLAASRKAEGDRKVVLNLEQGEVERVLSEVGGTRWKNALSG